MTNPYPIMARHDLQTIPARGFLGLGRRTRAEAELPKANGHQVHVYLTDGGLLVDHGQLRPDDPRVVGARHVSVVDMGRDVSTTILLKIPSAEASDFTVEVTFACTVTDASKVVRENLQAETALRHYLLNHRRIFQLGLPYKLMQISQVRIDVGAQISAYTTLRPPVISGLEVAMTSVQVHTPEEIATFENTRRQQLMDHMVSTEGMDLSRRREDLAADHEHDRELINQRHVQEIQARAQYRQQELEREQTSFAREELAAVYQAVGEDAHRARLLAHAAGELTAREVADQMHADDAAQALYAQQRVEAARLDERRERELDRSELRRADQYERDERLRLEQLRRDDAIDGREYERRLFQLGREERLGLDQREHDDEAEQRNRAWQREENERADRQREQHAERKRQQREIEYQRELEAAVKERQLEVLRQLRASGQLDMVNINVERLIADVIGVPVEDVRPQPVDWRAKTPAITTDEGNEEVPASDNTIDAEVREEDDL